MPTLQRPDRMEPARISVYADGHSEHAVIGASPFPRAWIYDHEGQVVAKTGLLDFKHWYRQAFGTHTPWGDEDSPALVTAVETALERELSLTIMRGGTKPAMKKLAEGKTLVEQGDRGDQIFLLLDGVVTVEVDGEPLAELGPGAVLGERALRRLAGRELGALAGTREETRMTQTLCQRCDQPLRGPLQHESREQCFTAMQATLAEVRFAVLSVERGIASPARA